MCVFACIHTLAHACRKRRFAWGRPSFSIKRYNHTPGFWIFIATRRPPLSMAESTRNTPCKLHMLWYKTQTRHCEVRTWVLDLHCDASPVLEHGRVHLPNGGSRPRRPLKVCVCKEV